MLKLKDTKSKFAFSYGYLLNKMYPYLRKVLFRTIILLLLAIPLGLLDGVVAFSLRPYLDYVVNGNPTQTFVIMGHTLKLQEFWIKLIPIGIVTFALIQGVLNTCVITSPIGQVIKWQTLSKLIYLKN